MFDLGKKIEEFTEELFTDLGIAARTEDEKADLFARVEDELQRAILSTLRTRMSREELGAVEQALAQESYDDLENLLKKYPQFSDALEEKIKSEFDGLKLMIAEEQKNVDTKPGKPGESGGSASEQPAGL